MKSKANNNLMWSLTIEQFDSNDEPVKSFDGRNKFTQTKINHDSSDTFKNITVNELMQTLNINQKEEIACLRGEIKEKNDLIKSLQKIINMLVDDQENTVKRTNRVHQQPIIPDKITSKRYNKPVVERNVETSNSYRKLNDLEDEERFTVSDESDTDEPFGRTSNILLNGNKKSNLKLKSKTNKITQSNPENNHFTNNYKRVTQPSNNSGNKPSKSLVLVVGDSTLKHITSYEIKKVL